MLEVSSIFLEAHLTLLVSRAISIFILASLDIY